MPIGRQEIKAAQEGVGKDGEIKSIDVVSDIWGHAADDKRSQVKGRWGVTPQRQDSSRMRESPRHKSSSTDPVRRNFEHERSNDNGVRVLLGDSDLALQFFGEGGIYAA